MLGGTAWLGHAVAERAVSRGHVVACLARGSAFPRGVEPLRADRDRDDALHGVRGRRWDAVVDVSSRPLQVRRAVRDLEPLTSRYAFVSSCSAYASLAEPGLDETAPLLAPLAGDDPPTMEQYGSAKVACEQAVLAGFSGDRSLLIRPGLIGGPGDGSGRSVYWPARFAHPSGRRGHVLIPDDPDLPTSVIDVRDLAAWIITLLEQGTTGVFNAAGDVTTLGAHLAAARAAAGHRGPVVPADVGWLLDRGVGQWAGPRSLPLWVADPAARGIGAISNRRARQSGLTPRPLAETLRDALAWFRGLPEPPPLRCGLSDDEELALLAELVDPVDLRI